ncbi:hypothetical protein FA15DRAFT_604312 [Coprinopsis marcescibilis]|uniref:Uncharacterized protein n=1 Tax=Coprinopsis marcescibilis TaxID=230819 RepID=A0A5C3KCR8_COPMA|nr:hypothetical protein FA15DRAFT_604312 [Coprinopsis marcescibilis]
MLSQKTQLTPAIRCRGIDPLTLRGCHCMRTVHPFCNICNVIQNGVAQSMLLQTGRLLESSLNPKEKAEHGIYKAMTNLMPDLEERLLSQLQEHENFCADLIAKGASSARADNTKAIKSNVMDWVTPNGEPLSPPLGGNVPKELRGYIHHWTRKLLAPAGFDWDNESQQEALRSGACIIEGNYWPLFVYKDYKYQPKKPWKGLFRSWILVKGFKHIFTSPTLVDKSVRSATRSSNAENHQMTEVTKSSIAYVAMQIRFRMSSDSTFSQREVLADSETFYESIMEILNWPSEHREIDQLLRWWNR